MKKMLAYMLAMLMTVSVMAGCEKDDKDEDDDSSAAAVVVTTEDTTEASEESSEPEESEEDSSETINEELIAEGIIATFPKDFTMEAELSSAVEGMEVTGTAIIAISGNNVYESFEMSGETTSVLILDSKMYMFDYINNLAIYMMDVPDTEAVNPMGADFTNFVTSGTKDINGTECYFETYGVSGVEISYYFDDGELYAFDTNMSGLIITMVITTFEDSADESYFTIPEGMTEISYTDYVAAQTNAQQ